MKTTLNLNPKGGGGAAVKTTGGFSLKPKLGGKPSLSSAAGNEALRHSTMRSPGSLRLI